MDRKARISAVVSQTTRELLERHVRATGVNKGPLVEQLIVHPKLVLTRKSGEGLLKEIETAKPTETLRDLLRDGE
jgi:hypothetical protein